MTDPAPLSTPDPQPATETAPPPIESTEQTEALPTRMRSAPVVGMVMLIVGLLVGYFGRPGLDRWISPPPPTAPAPQPLPQSKEELLPYLINGTRHFQGNPAAPVTLIEFGDFQ
jgi:hypothetical protein